MWISGCGSCCDTALSLSASASSLATRLSNQNVAPLASTEITMSFGWLSRTWLRSLGRATGTEKLTTGIVIRKMISSTSITSTSGVVLMVDTAWSSPPEAGRFIAMSGRHGRAAAHAGTAVRAGARSRRGTRTQQHRVQLAREVAHPVQRGAVAAQEEVVAQHRGHRDRQAQRRHDQRLAHRSRHLVDGGLPRQADGGQRVVDTPDRTEQADERR